MKLFAGDTRFHSFSSKYPSSFIRPLEIFLVNIVGFLLSPCSSFDCIACKRFNSNTRTLLRGNPWWGSYNTAKDYMFALIALTAAATFAILDTYIPSMAVSARSGAGFGIGANLVGFPGGL